MAAIGGIHILTDKKAKILTALKASLRACEPVISPEAAKKAKETITGDGFDSLYDTCGDDLCQDMAILLTDDYVSVCYEDIALETLEQNAAGYSEVFEKPAVYTLLLDEDVLVLGVYDGGKRRTRLIVGEYAGEYGLDAETINMDELARLYHASNLNDLNEAEQISDLIDSLHEDYGINPELSPLSLPLFFDEFKLLEKSESFSVYSAL